MLQEHGIPGTFVVGDGNCPPDWVGRSDEGVDQGSSIAPEASPEDVFDEGGWEETAQQVRPEVLARALNVLRGDAERMDGRLKREDLERQCFRRNLTVAECIQVERQLLSDGMTIIESQNISAAVGCEVAGDDKLLQKSRFLTESEERELGRKIQLLTRARGAPVACTAEYLARVEGEAIAAKGRFVETNIRWVRQIAGRFRYTGHLTEEDIFQEGVLGLIRATESFDPELGFRFKTYATWWIYQRIRRAISDTDRTVRLPVHVGEKMRVVRRAFKALLDASHEMPSIDAVAEKVGMETERLVELISIVDATNCTDGDAPVGDDEDDGATRFSFVAASGSPSPFDLAYRQELIQLLKQTLKSKAAIVISLRFGLDSSGEHTLEQIGTKLNLTRERVRQIEEKALGRLKRILSNPKYARSAKENGIIRSRARVSCWPQGEIELLSRD